jgi:C4-type Zn-finger protein
MLLHSIDNTMEIIACPLCGSKNTHSMRVGNQGLPYFARGYACEDCVFKGIPLIFASEKIYQNFLDIQKNMK